MKVWLSFLAVMILGGSTFGLTQPGMSAMTMNDSTLADLNGKAFEVAFMSGMIAHHQGATEMAQWILDRTDLPGVAGDARQVIAAQEPEIKLMQSWLNSWYGGAQDNKAAMMMETDMQGMTRALDAFDNPNVAFLTEMSLHHDSAIDMAQFALLKAVHPKLRELAKDIIRNQAQEIADYQETLRELTR